MFYIWAEDGRTFGFDSSTNVLYELKGEKLLVSNHNKKLVNVRIESHVLWHYGFKDINNGVYSAVPVFAVYKLHKETTAQMVSMLLRQFVTLTTTPQPLDYIASL